MIRKGFIYTLCCIFMLQNLWIKVRCQKYSRCSAGCCPHEFCAYHRICYPVIHCDPECPDGSCENGVCMPRKPCKNDRECGISRVCSMDFNLGYRVCQYNLDIGRTLCVDRYGKPNLKRGD